MDYNTTVVLDVALDCRDINLTFISYKFLPPTSTCPGSEVYVHIVGIYDKHSLKEYIPTIHCTDPDRTAGLLREEIVFSCQLLVRYFCLQKY